MDIEEFSALLNKNNSCQWRLMIDLRSMYDRNHLALERKAGSLVEVVQRFCSDGLFPIVDKKLKMVFGAWAHRLPRARLFEYFLSEEKKWSDDIEEVEAADRYITEGYGYFISSIRPTCIIVGTKYQPDSLDEVLFGAYEMDYIR